MTIDLGKYFGSILMFGFGLLGLFRWQQTQIIFFLLLVLRDFVAAYFFLKREKAQQKSGKFVSVIAYVSSAIPLMYFGESSSTKEILLISDIFAIIGFFIVALATIELGTSIGISPAKRTLVKSGIYNWINHPMYVGYILSEMGMCLINSMNIIFFVPSVFIYFYRSKSEIKLVKK